MLSNKEHQGALRFIEFFQIRNVNFELIKGFDASNILVYRKIAYESTATFENQNFQFNFVDFSQHVSLKMGHS